MASSYIKDDEGGTFIPASQRPDGTWRKPRRVKDGYVPQEEVPLYESKGKQFVKNQPSYPIGMSAEFVAAHKAKKEAEALKSCPIPGLVIQTEAKKKKKKNKNKTVSSLAEDLAKTTISEPEAPKKVPKVDNKAIHQNSKVAETSVEPTSPTQLTVDPAKRLKTLKKKLRETESLEQKIKTGEIKNPEKEMLEKVSRKAELKREIKRLEANH